MGVLSKSEKKWIDLEYIRKGMRKTSRQMKAFAPPQKHTELKSTSCHWKLIKMDLSSETEHILKNPRLQISFPPKTKTNLSLAPARLTLGENKAGIVSVLATGS